VIRRAVHVASDGEVLAGELLLPSEDGPHPAVLLIGGTLSDTRDGDPAASPRGDMPTHGMLRVIAEHLARAGFASLRWDKRGVGASSGGERSEHSDVWTDVDDAEQAYRALRAAPGVDPQRVVILGESAGAYFACFLARRLSESASAPVGYILQGALYSDIEQLLAFNYQRTANYCARGPDAAAWVKQVAPAAYGMGQHWRAMVAAARRGAAVYVAGVGNEYVRRPLRRLQQELAYPPAQQFRYIQGPTLVIQGDADMNVPPGDCHKVARALRAAGNDQVTLVVVHGADHSMQMAPADPAERVRERISMASFRRPYSPLFLAVLVDWLTAVIPEK